MAASRNIPTVLVSNDDQQIVCTCHGGERLGDQVHEVRLQRLAGLFPMFAAGQYLQVNVPGLGAAYYSIASEPGTLAIELHVEQRSNKSAHLINLAHTRSQITVELPFGHCCLSEMPDHALAMVGVDGFCPM